MIVVELGYDEWCQNGDLIIKAVNTIKGIKCINTPLSYWNLFYIAVKKGLFCHHCYKQFIREKFLQVNFSAYYCY